MNVLSRLTQIADECDARGLIEIANEIDDIVLSKMQTKQVTMLKPTPRRVWEKGEDSIPGPRGHKPWLKKKTKKRTKKSGISNSSNRFAQVDDPFGDEMSDEERASFEAQKKEEMVRKEKEFLASLSPEELAFLLENGITREDFDKQQKAEIAAEQGSGDWVSGFRHLGDEEGHFERGLESFEDAMDRAYGPRHREANRRIDSSMNRFSQGANLPGLLRILNTDPPEREEHSPLRGTPDEIRGRYDDSMRGIQDTMRDLPSDDPESPDFVSDEELGAASELLKGLESGSLYEGKEFCPECGFQMRDRDGEKYCPHCKMTENPTPRIASNMGNLGRIRDASKRSNLSVEQREQIMSRMR